MYDFPKVYLFVDMTKKNLEITRNVYSVLNQGFGRVYTNNKILYYLSRNL